MKEEIIAYIKNKYSAEVIILHGSRATGKSRENSDWDIFVFTKTDVKGQPEDYRGSQLDVITVQLPFEMDEFIDEYGYVLNAAEVLLDTDEYLGKRIIDEARKIYAFGKKLTDEKILNRKNYMQRTLDRMQGYIKKPELFFLYTGYFYEKALQYWFELKGRFSKPAYEAVENIKAEDQAYYDLLKVIFLSSTSDEQKFEAASKIYALLFE